VARETRAWRTPWLGMERPVEVKRGKRGDLRPGVRAAGVRALIEPRSLADGQGLRRGDASP